MVIHPLPIADIYLIKLSWVHGSHDSYLMAHLPNNTFLLHIRIQRHRLALTLKTTPELLSSALVSRTSNELRG